MCLFPLGRIGGFKAPPTGPPSHLDRYRLGQCPRGSLPWIHGWQHSSLHGIRHSHPLWASGRTQCYRISFWHCKPVHNRMDLFNTITTKSISTKSSTWVRQCVFLPCERQNGWPMGFVSRSFSPDLNSPRVINSFVSYSMKKEQHIWMWFYPALSWPQKLSFEGFVFECTDHSWHNYAK